MLTDRIRTRLWLPLACIALAACASVQAETPITHGSVARVMVKEAFLTPLSPPDNLDSPAVWHGPNNQNLLFATAKSSHSVLVYDAVNGAPIRRLGGQGSMAGQFDRPNGIWVIDDYLFVVERDNHRVQVFTLPDMVSRATFGEAELDRPYGLWVQRTTPNEYRVYVTDNYDAGPEGNPDLSRLGERVRVFEVEAEGQSVEGEIMHSFGDTTGAGVLHKVESLHGDPAHNRLLIADEDEILGRDIKVYDLAGRFTGEVLGDGLFLYEPEGIALHESDVPGEGYWIMTDQGKEENLFYIFDRRTLKHLGTFEGEFTLNTDGIWLSQAHAHPRFPAGVFYAVHDDASVAAFSWAEVLESLGLR